MFELFYLIIKLINLYEIVIIAWVIMGWLQMFNALPYSRPVHMIMGVLYSLADPFLGFFRRILPPVGGLDLSPLVAIITLEVVKILLREIML
ncbi:MAG: YggT family protein [Proteobacteria bacterium]|nr:YggT family protein [Pseudomonadota bacterium]